MIDIDEDNNEDAIESDDESIEVDNAPYSENDDYANINSNNFS